MENTPFFKSKFPLGVYLIIIVFILSVSFFSFKGMDPLWAFLYSLIILLIGLSSYRNHYTIRMYEDFFEIKFFNPFKKQKTIYYKTIMGFENENGLFLKYEYITGSFITTEDKLIINYKESNQKKTLSLKVVSGIKFDKMFEKLSEKINHVFKN